MTVHELVSVLADPDVLRARCRALTLLDVVLGGFAARHDYFPGWRASVDLATMENGSGDLYGVVFDPETGSFSTVSTMNAMPLRGGSGSGNGATAATG
ncbi:hypothetical protein [Streptomyces sp. NPDC053069]|uniref:hypothetical protein n=1 Tax=Streptomyces sp. NPDC053069 TaxID=3365695 RepID=UPI0037D8DD70